jgi:hypothetical protein
MTSKFHSNHYKLNWHKHKDYAIRCEYAEFLEFETLLENMTYDLEHGEITISEFIDKQLELIKDFKREFCYDLNSCYDL